GGRCGRPRRAATGPRERPGEQEVAGAELEAGDADPGSGSVGRLGPIRGVRHGARITRHPGGGGRQPVAGDWGALATGEADYYTDYWLNTPDYLNDERFNVAILKPWVLNQQPAHISALADQFQKAHDLLVEVERTGREHTR